MELAKKRCVPCEGGATPLPRGEAEALLAQLPDWELSPDGARITRRFSFADFAGAVAFANRVAAVAEQEGHHPDLHVSWGKVVVELSTHALGGLSENDFILAAKIDELVV